MSMTYLISEDEYKRLKKNEEDFLSLKAEHDSLSSKYTELQKLYETATVMKVEFRLKLNYSIYSDDVQDVKFYTESSIDIDQSHPDKMVLDKSIEKMFRDCVCEVENIFKKSLNDRRDYIAKRLTNIANLRLNAIYDKFDKILDKVCDKFHFGKIERPKYTKTLLPNDFYMADNS